jgi:hypothetical protein
VGHVVTFSSEIASLDGLESGNDLQLADPSAEYGCRRLEGDRV